MGLAKDIFSTAEFWIESQFSAVCFVIAAKMVWKNLDFDFDIFVIMIIN
jgi:hypothetical protein